MAAQTLDPTAVPPMWASVYRNRAMAQSRRIELQERQSAARCGCGAATDPDLWGRPRQCLRCRARLAWDAERWSGEALGWCFGGCNRWLPANEMRVRPVGRVVELWCDRCLRAELARDEPEPYWASPAYEWECGDEGLCELPGDDGAAPANDLVGHLR